MAHDRRRHRRSQRHASPAHPRYRQLLEDSAVLAIDGRQVPVASLDAIIRSKEIVDRPKDREALPELRELRDRHRELDPPDLGRHL